MSSDRNPNGTFRPGWAGGPGRPRRQAEARYLSVTIESVSLEEWRLVVRQAVADALSGDHRAREWLSGYLLGRPRETVELLRDEGGEGDGEWAGLSDEELEAVIAKADSANQAGEAKA